jgi:hypothetical protein
MAPKKKGTVVVGGSTSGLPAPTQTGDIMGAGGGGGDHELPRRFGDQSQASGIIRNGGGDNPRATRSRDGAVLPTGGAANSKGETAPSKTPTPAHVSRPSQVGRDEQRRDVGAPR